MFITTFFNTYISYNDKENKLYHGNNRHDYINAIIDMNKIYLVYSDKILNSNNFNTKYIYFFNELGLISLYSLQDGFLSARPNGTFQFMPHNQGWEKYSLVDNTLGKYFNKYINERDTKDKILICCCGGRPYSDDYFNTDLNENKELNIFKLDITKNFDIPDNSLDFIYVEHGLEHINIDGLINFINESFRTLKNDGVLRFSSPSLEFWGNYYINKSEDIDFVTKQAYERFIKKDLNLSKAIVFNNAMRNWGHKLLLDYETYEYLLKSSGFKLIERKKTGESKYNILKNIEKRVDKYSLLESLTIEATK